MSCLRYFVLSELYPVKLAGYHARCKFVRHEYPTPAESLLFEYWYAVNSGSTKHQAPNLIQLPGVELLKS